MFGIAVVPKLLESDRKSQWIPRRVLRCSELFHGRMLTCVLEVELIFIEVLIWVHVRSGSQLAIGQVRVCPLSIRAVPLHELRE